jgi:hypothetical protein
LELKKLGYQLIAKLSDHKLIADFEFPVNHKILGLIDYLDIVKRPMDLSTIRKKLRAGKFAAFSELVGDVDLIWEN